MYNHQESNSGDKNVNMSDELEVFDARPKLFIVVLHLSSDALSAIELSRIKVKSPTKKQLAVSKRAEQVSHYKANITQEGRNRRFLSRQRQAELSTAAKKLTFDTEKKVRFSLK